MAVTWTLQMTPKGWIIAYGAGGSITEAGAADVGDRLIEPGKPFRGRDWKTLRAMAERGGSFTEET